MSDAVLYADLESSHYVNGARVITKANLDMIDSSRRAQSAVSGLESALGRVGSGSSSGMTAAKRAMNEMSSITSGIRHQMEVIHDRIIRIGATVLIFRAVTESIRGVLGVLREAVNYMSQMETAQLGIASSFMVVGKYYDVITNKQIEGQRAFTISQKDSREAINQLRIANLSTIATLDQLVQGYQIALPVALKKGFSKDQVVEFTKSIYQMAGAIGLPFDQMSEEIRSLLGQSPLGKNSRLAQILGLDTVRAALAKFKNDGKGLAEYYRQLLAPYDIAGIASQKTFLGLLSNIKDVMKMISESAFASTFENVKKQMTGVMEMFVTIDNVSKNAVFSANMIDKAKEVGKFVNEMFTNLMNSITSDSNKKWFGTLIEELAGLAKAIATVVNWMVAHSAVLSTLLIKYVEFKFIVGALTNAKKIYDAVQRSSAISEDKLIASKIAAAKETEALANKEKLLAAYRLDTARQTKAQAMAEYELAVAKERTAAISTAQTKFNDASATRANLEFQSKSMATRMSKMGLPGNTMDLLGEGKWYAAQEKMIELERRLTAAKLAEAAAEMELNAAKAGGNVLTAETIALKEKAALASKQASLAAVDLDHATNQSKKAANDYANALDRKTTSSRIASAATRAMGGVFNLLGGWIGITVIGLLGLVAMWNKLTEAMYANQRAIEKRRGESASLISNLQTELAALTAKERKEKGQVLGEQDADILLFGGNYPQFKAKLEERALLIKEAQDRAGYVRSRTGGIEYGVSEEEMQKAVNKDKQFLDLQKQILNVDNEIKVSRDLQRRVNEKSQSKYKTEPMTTKFTDGSGAALSEWNMANREDDAYYRYLKSLNALAQEEIKANAERELEIVNEGHKNRLVSEEQFARQLEDVRRRQYDNAVSQQKSLIAEARLRERAAEEQMFDYLGGSNKAYWDKFVKHDKTGEEVPGARARLESMLEKEVWDMRTNLNKAIEDGNALKHKGQIEELKGQQSITDGMRKDIEITNELTQSKIQGIYATIDAQEKFYEISTGEAALKRVALIQQEIDLEEKRYREIYGNNGTTQKMLDDQRNKINALIIKQREYNKTFENTTAIGGMKSALEEYGKSALDVGAQVKSMWEKVIKSMEDAMVNFAQTGKMSFKGMIDSVVADIIRLQVRQYITGPGANMLSGNVGGFANLISNGGSVSSFGGAVGGFGTDDWFGVDPNARNYVSPESSSTSSWGNTSIYAAIIATAAQQIGKYFGKGGRWSQHSKGQQNTIKTTTLLGSVFGMGLGSLVPGFLDWATNGYLFGSGWKTSSAGLELGVNNGDVLGSMFNVEKKKKSWFGGNTTRTTWTAIDNILEDYLTTQFAGISKNVKIGSRLLGGTGDLSNFSSATTRIALSGLTAEQQQKAIEDYFRGLSSEAIESLYPTIKEFAKLGEDSTATFQRLTTSLKLVNNIFEIFGLSAKQLSIYGAQSADVLVQALGGLESAMNVIDAYFTSSLFTDTEQKAIKQQQAYQAVTETFNELGMKIPKSNEEFKNLVKQQLALGDSGAEAAAALMKIAPAFAELTISVTEATTAVSVATQKMLANAKSIVDASISTTANILGTLKGILSGSAAGMSPEAAYLQAKQMFASSDATNAAERGTRLLEASKAYNATNAAYFADLASVTNKLAALAETTTTLSDVDRQIQMLADIKAAIESGDQALIAVTQVTYNAAQIDLGLASNSLSKALANIQAVLNTPITATTAKDTITQQINALQAVLGSTGGIAKTAIQANIDYLKLQLNGVIDGSAAKVAIDTNKAIIKGALDKTIDGTLAASAISLQAAMAQAALSGALNGSTATAAIDIQKTIIQGALNGSIDGAFAKSNIDYQRSLMQASLNNSINGVTAKTAINSQAAIIQLALQGTISGTAAQQAIDTQKAIIQLALNGAITATDAEKKIKDQYTIIQSAANGAISASTAELKIKEQYDTINTALGGGVSGALTSISDALAIFNKAVSDSTAQTAESLGNFVTAMELLQTYPTALANFKTTSTSLLNQYSVGSISRDQYSTMYADNYNKIKADYDRGISAGLTTLTAPSGINLVDADNARMKTLASGIAGWLAADQYVSNPSSPYGISGPGASKYNIYTADGKSDFVNYQDLLLWQQLATGSLKWNTLGLPAFATGGVTNTPSIFGEAGWEAAVPLPDGRSIPVTLSGGREEEVIAKLEEQNELLKQQIRTMQAAFTEMIANQKEGNKSLKGVEGNSTLAKRAA